MCRCSRENEPIGAIRHLPRKMFAVYRQADRAGQELRRSSRHRHRERAAAQRTAPAHADSEAWSSRPRPPKCFKLSAALPAILSRCLRLCWRRPSAFAMPNSATSVVAGRRRLCVTLPRTTCRQLRRSARRSPYSSPGPNNPVRRMMNVKDHCSRHRCGSDELLTPNATQ